MTNNTMFRLYDRFLQEHCNCSEDELGNRPCDYPRGALCDRCLTPEAQAAWKLTVEEYEARYSYTLDSFLSKCTACGGNWTRMYLTGIEACWPEIYKAMPDWTYEFDEVSFIVCSLVTDQETTYCGVPVNKHICPMNDHVIEYCGDDTFQYTTRDADMPLREFDNWYVEHCGVTPEAIEAFKEQKQQERKLADCKSILWELCGTWGKNKDEQYKYYSMDSSKVYDWLVEQDDFVNEVYATETHEELETLCERWFDDEVLEQPLSKFLWNWKDVTDKVMGKD